MSPCPPPPWCVGLLLAGFHEAREGVHFIFQVSDPNLVTRGDVAEFFLDVGVSRLDVLALGLALGGAEEDVDDGWPR